MHDEDDLYEEVGEDLLEQGDEDQEVPNAPSISAVPDFIRPAQCFYANGDAKGVLYGLLLMTTKRLVKRAARTGADAVAESPTAYMVVKPWLNLKTGLSTKTNGNRQRRACLNRPVRSGQNQR